ncbi:MAG: aldo/keto reductase, partial [Tardiphaga sp.]
ILVAGSSAMTTYDHVPAQDDIRAKVRRIEDICAAHGVSLPAAALQFPLRHPAVTAVLPGARTKTEIDQIAAWFNADIPEAFWQEVM